MIQIHLHGHLKYIKCSDTDVLGVPLVYMYYPCILPQDKMLATITIGHLSEWQFRSFIWSMEKHLLSPSTTMSILSRKNPRRWSKELSHILLKFIPDFWLYTEDGADIILSQAHFQKKKYSHLQFSQVKGEMYKTILIGYLSLPTSPVKPSVPFYFLAGFVEWAAIEKSLSHHDRHISNSRLMSSRPSRLFCRVIESRRVDRPARSDPAHTDPLLPSRSQVHNPSSTRPLLPLNSVLVAASISPSSAPLPSTLAPLLPTCCPIWPCTHPSYPPAFIHPFPQISRFRRNLRLNVLQPQDHSLARRLLQVWGYRTILWNYPWLLHLLYLKVYRSLDPSSRVIRYALYSLTHK